MEDKEKKPLIPTLKDSKKPELKIKGLAGAGTQSLLERVKQFKKKDLAFILAGLGVLFMAPLAEHFMMSPETGDGSSAYKEGWGFRDGAGAFGKGGSPYEGGVNGLAPGGVLGGGGDVITPLNVRDPSALVMGPGATQPTPVAAPTPPPPAPKADSGGWKDALANAASRGAREATKSASLPVPKVPLQGALRGLGAVSGGTSGGYNLPGISASNVPNTAAGSNSLSRAISPTGYKGVAGPQSSRNAQNSALENLKKAAGMAASEMNRGGSAAGNLDATAAASQGIPGGSTGGEGGPGSGAADKAPSGSSLSGSRSPAGEDLNYAMKKARMEKELELEFKKREKKEMMWPNLEEKMAETLLTKGLAEPFAKLVGGVFEKAKPDAAATIACSELPPGKAVSPPKQFGALPDCNLTGSKPDDAGGEENRCFNPDTGCVGIRGQAPTACGCGKSDGSAKPAVGTTDPKVQQPPLGGDQTGDAPPKPVDPGIKFPANAGAWCESFETWAAKTDVAALSQAAGQYLAALENTIRAADALADASKFSDQTGKCKFTNNPRITVLEGSLDKALIKTLEEMRAAFKLLAQGTKNGLVQVESGKNTAEANGGDIIANLEAMAASIQKMEALKKKMLESSTTKDDAGTESTVAALCADVASKECKDAIAEFNAEAETFAAKAKDSGTKAGGVKSDGEGRLESIKAPTADITNSLTSFNSAKGKLGDKYLGGYKPGSPAVQSGSSMDEVSKALDAVKSLPEIKYKTKEEKAAMGDSESCGTEAQPCKAQLFAQAKTWIEQTAPASKKTYISMQERYLAQTSALEKAIKEKEGQQPSADAFVKAATPHFSGDAKSMAKYGGDYAAVFGGFGTGKAAVSGKAVTVDLPSSSGDVKALTSSHRDGLQDLTAVMAKDRKTGSDLSQSVDATAKTLK